MSLSRGIVLFKQFKNISKPMQQIRMAGDGTWSYRSMGLHNVSKESKIAGDVMIGIMFWWMLYNYYHNYGHVIGEWPEYPDPTKWTDAELGIPPDDE